MANTFKALLKRLQKAHYPSTTAFAAALGIDATRISRGTPFDVRGCLKLSHLTGEPPSVVLRAAGKGDIATLIESLYGPGQPLLTLEQRQLLDAFSRITRSEDREALLRIARGVAAPPEMTHPVPHTADHATPFGVGSASQTHDGGPPKKISDDALRRVGTQTR